MFGVQEGLCVLAVCPPFSHDGLVFELSNIMSRIFTQCISSVIDTFYFHNYYLPQFILDHVVCQCLPIL